ncbi:MAG: hypothetical protein ING77_15435 [Rhodocyclaceae bacterium]|nr:hypothetical protein [Rhodocyclaceae bacterium]
MDRSSALVDSGGRTASLPFGAADEPRRRCELPSLSSVPKACQASMGSASNTMPPPSHQ